MINYNTILDIFILEIIPRTFKNIEIGNKIFSGAILDINDYSIVTIGLNNEIKNPLFMVKFLQLIIFLILINI